MAALSDAQLWSVVTGAGFTGQDALTAFCIALAESGGDPSKTNTKNTNGTTDFGLFQINSVHTALLSGKNWQDPATNAAMAFSLYKGRGNKFTDWVTYNSRSYARFLARAQAASVSGGAPVPASTETGSTDTTSDPVATGIANATSGSTWLRIGMFLAGAILLLIFLASVVKNTSIGKTVTKVGKTVAKTAAVA